MTLRYQRSQLFARANPLSKLAIATLFIAALMVGITSQNAFAQGADGSLNFYFVTLASAGEMDGVNHFMTMTGSGRFNADLVEGGGAYQFFDANTEVPRTLLGSGQWQAVRVINWSMVEGDNPNPYGVNAAGVLDLEILMFPLDEGGEGTPATLRIVCNVGIAGLMTGLAEGIVLETNDGLTHEPILFPTDPAVEGIPAMIPFGITLLNLPRVP